ncbi:PaaI family thioesterase [Chitinophaga vietnamensis]|uniref:PaaI family thioesterase n=1 Tax=Chitinophaga vietnamensis TaxID=2593957 RepID=UPI001375DF71|nr:PaaI family thioesterase [Chitinophaga vietnamensis]
MTTPLAPEIEQRVRDSFGRQKLMAMYGATITGIGKGYFEISMPPSDITLRPSGIFHGSAIAGVTDVVAGYSATTIPAEDPYFVTVEFKINFLNQAKGELLIGKGKVIKAGATLTIVQADIFTRNGEQETHAATALVTMMRINKR